MTEKEARRYLSELGGDYSTYCGCERCYVVDTGWLTQKIEEAARIVHGALSRTRRNWNLAQLERFEVIAFEIVLKELLMEDPPEPVDVPDERV